MKRLEVTIEIEEDGSVNTKFSTEGNIDAIDMRTLIVELDMLRYTTKKQAIEGHKVFVKLWGNPLRALKMVMLNSYSLWKFKRKIKKLIP